MYVKLHETEDFAVFPRILILPWSHVVPGRALGTNMTKRTVAARDLWLLTIFGEDKLHLGLKQSGKDRPAMPVSFSSGISQSERVYITRIDQRSHKNNQGRGVALATSTSTSLVSRKLWPDLSEMFPELNPLSSRPITPSSTQTTIVCWPIWLCFLSGPSSRGQHQEAVSRTPCIWYT